MVGQPEVIRFQSNRFARIFRVPASRPSFRAKRGFCVPNDFTGRDRFLSARFLRGEISLRRFDSFVAASFAEGAPGSSFEPGSWGCRFLFFVAVSFASSASRCFLTSFAREELFFLTKN